MALSREAIFAAKDIQTEEVPVPEWGGSVLVRGLTSAERVDFENSMSTLERHGRKQEVKLTLANLHARLAALTIVDEDGVRIFSDADVAALGRKSGPALQRVWEVARRLSGMSEEDAEEIVKNSAATPNEPS